MRVIKELSDMIRDEIEDARKYALCANAKKADNKPLADLFFKLSNDELGHMALLHAEVVKLIEKYRKDSGDPPALMMEMYEMLHKEHIEKAAEVKQMLALYQS